jgi:hypothetical protein
MGPLVVSAEKLGAIEPNRSPCLEFETAAIFEFDLEK